MTILICDCNADRACLSHAADLAPAKTCVRCDHECDADTMGCDCGGVENWQGDVCCACDVDSRQFARKVLADIAAMAKADAKDGD